MIEILGMTGCAPCKNVKKLLAEKDVDFAYHNAKLRGNARTTELKKLYFNAGVKTMPGVFKDGVFVGTGIEAVQGLV